METASGGSYPGADDAPRPFDQSLLRGATTRRLARRHFLGISALTAGGLLSGAATGCGSGQRPPRLPAERALPRVSSEAFWLGKRRTGRVDFANWPLYIDTSETRPGDHPSLDLFASTTGIRVDYREVIQDPDAFYRQIRPALAVGAPIGYDLMVFTNDQTLADLIRLNYLAPLDRTRLSTFFRNADAAVINPSYDPGNAHTVAWQSGITGIAYHPGRTGRDVESFEDLFDPAFTGRIGMFGDTRDLPNFTLVGMGVKPETSTPSDWKKAAAKLHHQREAGLVRTYYQQDYIDALKKGEIWISMAWSGDVYQANATGAGLRFVIPKEGGLLFTDSLVIPATASHPVDAIAYMDFVYRTDVAAMLAESINYITPVPFSREQVLLDANNASGARATALRGVADSPLVYPARSDLDRLSRYRVLDPDEAGQWNSIFRPVYS